MNGFTNTIVREKKAEFSDWQENYMRDLGGEIKFKGRLIKNKEYLNYFYDYIRDLIISNGYTIINEKEFRNKIGSFIYKISE